MGKKTARKTTLDEDFLEKCKQAASQSTVDVAGDDDGFPTFNGFGAEDDFSSPKPAAPTLEPTVFDRFLGRDIVVREDTPAAIAFAKAVSGAVEEGKKKKKKATTKEERAANLLKAEAQPMKGSKKMNKRKKKRASKAIAVADRVEAKAAKAEARRLLKQKRSKNY